MQRQKCNDTSAWFDDEVTLQEIFQRQAAATPDAPAVLFGSNTLTYRQLNDKANGLAVHLRQRGLRREEIVGILCERSFDMMIGILAILKAGGAYLPLSQAEPGDRFRRIVEDSGIRFLLTQEKFAGKITFDGELIQLDTYRDHEGTVPDPPVINTSRDLAYIIYTSGSTGMPKGVMIEHRSVVNRLTWMQRDYPISTQDTILQKTPFTFDVSVWELFWWFFAGAKVSFLPPGHEKNPVGLLSAIQQHAITVMHFVPSLLGVFLEYLQGRPSLDPLASLRLVFSSGEALPAKHVARFNEILNKDVDRRLINLYGPTEATVDVTHYDCAHGPVDGKMPIGKPISNTRLFISEEDELLIGGIGVARGYLNRVELTTEKFIDDPDSAGDKLYKTGDVCRWLEDGNVDYLNRKDHQVKIAGIRIELGEIEAALSAHPLINDSVVNARKYTDSITAIHAYYTAPEDIDPRELKKWLSGRLPEYMIPHKFMRLDTIPLTANGKADRKALPEPLDRRSLVEVLYTAAGRQQSGITFINGREDDAYLSYSRLVEAAEYALHNLRTAGLRQGSELIIQLEDNSSFLILFWACLIGKIIPVPLSFGGQEEHKKKVLAVWQSLTDPWLVTTDEQLQRLLSSAGDNAPQPETSHISDRYISVPAALENNTRATDFPSIRPNDIAYIQYSSGSTGDPKGVILTHHNLLYNARDIAARSATGPGDKALSWMPLTHDMGMICFHLSSLLMGIDQYLIPTALFIRRPSLWLIKASQYRATQLYSPNFGYQYTLSGFTRDDSAGLDLSAVRLIYNGAEPIDADICRQFLQAMAPYGMSSAVFFPGYGLAEASVAVALPVPGEELRVHYVDRSRLTIGDTVEPLHPADKKAVSFVEVGFPMDHCKVRIAAANDEPLPAGTVGHIQIRGLNVTSGYYRHEQATAGLFTADGWLRTGDVGFFAQDRLVITGREKQLLIIHGQNYYPHDIERTVRHLPGLSTGRVVACAVKEPDEKSDRLVLFVLFKQDVVQFRQTALDLRSAILERTGLEVDDIVPIKKIPKTTSGKIQHFQLIGRYKAGDWAAECTRVRQFIAEARATALGEGTSLTEILTALWKDTTGRTISAADEDLLHSGVTSLLLIRFQAAVTRHTGKFLSMQDLFGHATLRDLERMITSAPRQLAGDYRQPAGKWTGGYPLTPVQHRFYMLEQLRPEGNPLCITHTVTLDKKMDSVLLQHALLQCGKRHPVLTAAFRLTEEGPVQVTREQIVPEWQFEDLSARANAEDQARQYLQAIALQPFDLQDGVPFRVTLIKLSPEKYWLSLMMHHLIGDGWTLTLLKEELLEMYTALQENRQPQLPVTTPFPDYAAWYSTAYRDGEQYPADLQYWQSHYAGFNFEPLFPPQQIVDRRTNDFRSSSLAFHIDSEKWRALKTSAAEHRVSALSILYTLVTAWVHKYTGKTDLAIGTVMHGRLSPELENAVGCMANTVVPRNILTAEDTLEALLQRVSRGLISAYDHQLAPMNFIMDRNGMEVLILFQQFRHNGSADAAADIPVLTGTALAPLVIEFSEDADGLECRIDGQERYFSPAQLAFFPAHFMMLADALLHKTNQLLSATNMLPPAEECLLLESYNPKPRRASASPDVLLRFEARAAAHPHAPAILFEEECVSYAELHHRIADKAARLSLDFGLTPGSRVGICMPRGIDAMVALLAVLSAGCSYCYLDPEYPRSRLDWMMADSEIQLLLEEKEITVIRRTAGSSAAADVATLPAASGEAYVIYTSGTTGTPKGIPISRRALNDYTETVIEYFNIGPADTVIQQSALSFDTLIEEIFPALCTGAAIRILRDGGRNIEAILDAIAAGATILSTTPTVVAGINRYAERAAGLRVLISGGETLHHRQADQLLARGIPVFNTYGPSETTVCATYYPLQPNETDGNILIGKVLPNRKVFLLDAMGQLVPCGATGEIYIGGTGVASGYLHLPDLSKEHFLTDTFSNDASSIDTCSTPARLYRTGDLGRWRSDGNLEFLGRMDRQIKVNGYRIETSEIEAQLAAGPGITSVAVLLRSGSDRHPVLTCFYNAAQPIEAAVLRAFAHRRLPLHMIPAVWAYVGNWPVTAHGKIDYAALQALEIPSHDASAEIPLTPLEQQLLEGWRLVLDNASCTGRHDHFFEKGGNSLTATRLLLWVQQQWNIQLTLKDIFLHPTAGELAEQIANRRRSADNIPATPLPRAPRAAAYPLSSGQKRLWMLDSFGESNGAYNLCWAYLAEGDIRAGYFEQAVRLVMDRHEILRTNFIFRDNLPWQIVRDDAGFQVSMEDWRNQPAQEGLAQEDRIQHYIASFAGHPFDLGSEPLLRAGIAVLDQQRSLVVIALHHIVADAWSMGLLSTQISQAYNAILAGLTEPAPTAEPEALQYKDFACWQQQMLQAGHWGASRQFWLEQFQGEIPVLQLPADKPRPAVQSNNGDTLRYLIPRGTQRQLEQLAGTHNCSLFVVLLSAVNTLLYKLTGQSDIVIGVPVSGRIHPDLSSQVGFYVNTLPLRSRIIPGEGFDALLTATQQYFLQAFEHQAWPFDLLLEDLDLVRDTSRNPLFVVMVDLLNVASGRHLQLDGVSLRPVQRDHQTSQVDLSFDFIESPGELQLQLNYNSDIFSSAGMQRFLQRFITLLDSIAADAHRPVRTLDYLGVAEQTQLLTFSGEGNTEMPAADLVTLFEQMAAAHEKEPALWAEGTVWSYNDLNAQANRLAHCLVQEYGMQPGARVGIMVDRNAWMVIGVLAVLKARAAYVPIDPNDSPQRITHIISESGIDILLTTSAFGTSIPCLQLSAFGNKAAGYQDTNLPLRPATDDLAYLIYTSGTTGRPKGVMIRHRQLLSLWDSLEKVYGLGTFPVRLLQMANFSFDVFFGDMLRSIFRGGTMFICPAELRLSLPDLYTTINNHKITILESTPGLLLPLLDYMYEEGLDTAALRVLIIGSDTLLEEDYRRILDRFGASGTRIINSYGTTETTIDASYFEGPLTTSSNRGYVPVGRPIPNTRMYILDEGQGMCGIGVKGELCIGGAGVGAGYWSREELTKERFIDDPYTPGGRLYRTGDQGRWREDGVVEYLGRGDSQVKIRGYRVELGEVEAALQSYEAVKEAVVLAREGQLIAYIVWRPPVDGSRQQADEAGLREHCRRQLPVYMHPGQVVAMESLPLTANGKIDRKRLPEVTVSPEAAYEGARTATEAALVAIWQEVLERDRIGIRDHFFQLGGHSLKGIRVLWRIRKELGVELSFREVFSHPELWSLAAEIDRLTGEGASSSSGGTSTKEQNKTKTIPPAAPQADYPLSHAQRRLWLLDRLEGGGQTYTMPVQYRIEGDLDVARLEAALNQLIARHEILRTVFIEREGIPFQQVLASAELRIAYADCRGTGEVEECLRAHREQVFDLSVFPLLSAGVYRTGETEQIFAFNIHHIISDEWSTEVMIKELRDLYAGTTLEALRLQYKDYSVWQQQLLAEGEWSASGQYWREQFADGGPVLDIPLDYSRPAVRSWRGGTVRVRLDQKEAEAVRQLSRKGEASLYMTLLATVKGLLHRYSGQEELVIGSPVAGRRQEQLSDQLGFYVNTLALRTAVNGKESFSTLLEKVKTVVLSGMEHQDYPFDRLVEELQVDRDLSRSPLFDVMVVLQSATGSRPAGWEEMPVGTAISKFDLTWLFREENDGSVSIEIEYNTDIYSRERIDRMGGHYRSFVSAVAKAGDAPLAAIEYIPAAEREEILTVFSGKGMERSYPRERSIGSLYKEKAAEMREATAVISGDRSWSYTQLDEWSDRVAQHLVGRYGVQRGDRVGVMLDRSERLIACLLGVLKAGAAYVPVDPAYPQERIGYMLTDSRPRVVITEGPARPANVAVMNLEEEWTQLPPHDPQSIPECPAETLAYIIYTSGSTGTPKGAMIPHTGVVNLCTWLDEIIYSGHPEPLTAMLTASINFDASVQQLFAPLISGSKLVMVPESAKRKIDTYIQQLKQYAVEVIDITPGYLRLLLEALKEGDATGINLRYVLVGGEALDAEVRTLFHEVLGKEAQLINVYGVTEAAVDSTWQRITPGRHRNGTAIGRPIPNTRMYILDEGQGMCGIGVKGELCIGGAGVGAGYWSREELTKERFIDDPYTPGGRLYRTGDQGRWREDGVVEYLGRGDSQVKIRGYRVELGEVEAALQSYEAVKEAVVLAREGQLIAYIVWRPPVDGSRQQADEAGLREHCRRQLPVYMHPGQVVAMESLPLTANGKIDRKRLPEVTVSPEAAYEGARTATEAALVAIWQEVLERDRIGIRDHFFQLGGHSLKGIRVLWRIRKELGVELSFREVFSHPELWSLAAEIDRLTGEGASSSSGGTSTKEQNKTKTIPPAAPQADYPLSHAQRRLWLLDRLEGGGQTYTMPVQYRIEGDLDVARLEAALNQLIARHEILRTVFIEREGIPFQQVLASAELRIAYADCRGTGEVEECLRAHREQVFDLSVFPLLSAGVYRTGETEQIFAFNIHHIISDEWSTEVMIKELRDLYAGTTLEALRLQYKDYSVWQQQLLAEGEWSASGQYWREQFADGGPVLDIPLDYSRPAVRSWRGGTVRVRLDQKEAEAVRQLSRKGEASLYMTLLATVKGLLHRYSGQEELVIGSPVAGRRQEQLSDQLGFYVNTLALRTAVNGKESFSTLLEKVKTVVLSGMEHQDYPFDRLVEELQVDRDLSRSPLFDVMVVLQSATGSRPAGWEEMPVGTAISKFDLTWLFREENDGSVSIEIEYNTDIYSRERIDRMGGHYRSFVSAVAKAGDAPLAAIEYIPAAEREEILTVFSGKGMERSYPRERSIGSLYKEKAAEMREATAVISGDRSWSYTQLDEWSDRVAQHLVGRYGVQRGDRVGVMLDRSERLIACLLGVLKAGAAYVPVDPAYPQERIGYMLTDSRPRVVITEGPARPANVAVMNLEEEWTQLPPHDPQSIPECPAETLAYIIYTSGSTGTPKGAMIPHRGVVRLVCSPNYVSLREGDRLLQTGSISFDASTFEIWGMLLNGGTLYLLPQEHLLDNDKLGEAIAGYGITTMWFSAPWFNQLVDQAPNIFQGLNQILVGGDKLSQRHISRVRELYPDLHMINGYGPTENTTFSICHAITRIHEGEIPLGRPVTGTGVYILDGDLRPVPVGGRGEIYLSGDGLATGYLNREDKTTEAFLPDPFEPGGVMYRTGDQGCWNSSGQILFLGRADDQVKIRGYRIEPGEIASVLLTFPGLKDALVMPFTGARQEKELVAYLVWTANSDEAALRVFLRGKLPAYMLPDYYLTLDSLPLNANGKIDRKALPAPLAGKAVSLPIEQLDDRETRLLAIWSDILQRNDIGLHDNFFEIGGHSLKASTLGARIQKEFGLTLSLKTLFIHNTIDELAALIAGTGERTFEPLTPAPARPWYPLSHAQHRLWVIHQLDPESAVYNIPGAYLLNGQPDILRLQHSLDVLVQRHESLRTIFVRIDGQPAQQIIPADRLYVTIEFTDVTMNADPDTAAGELVRQLLHQPIDPGAWPLFRSRLIKKGPEEFIFVFCIHHIISDGWSQQLIAKELSTIYRALGVAQPLPPFPTLQYRDYSEWHNKLLSGAWGEEASKYWKTRFEHPAPSLQLPADYLRPKQQTYAGDTVRIDFGTDATWGQPGDEKDVTLFMRLLAMVNILIHRYTGSEDIVITSPVAAREHADLHNQLGFFANTLAIRSAFRADQTFGQLVQSVKQSLLDAYRYQMYPFDKIIEDAAWLHDPAHAPLSDIMVVLQSNEPATLDLPGVTATLLDLNTDTARFDLVFIFSLENGRLCLDLGFNTDIYARQRIEAMATAFKTILQLADETASKTIGELAAAGNPYTPSIPDAIINGHAAHGYQIDAALKQMPGIADAWTLIEPNKRPEIFIVPDTRDAGLIQRQLQWQLERPGASAPSGLLPNGLPMYFKNKAETDFVYDEIFTRHGYLRNGIRLQPGDVIFDVGANTGMFSLYAGYHFPGAKIFAFEPIPPLFEFLQANATIHEADIVPLNLGLSSDEGSAEFVYYPNNTIISGRFGNDNEDRAVVSRYLRNKAAAEGDTISDKHLTEILDESMRSETWVCRMSTLSRIIEEYSVDQIGLLKIDVEKSEWDILMGIDAQHWRRIRQVIVEVHDIDGRLEKVTTLLEGHGFTVTTEQEQDLAGTALYNLYAISADNTQQPEQTATPVCRLPEWLDTAVWTEHIRQQIALRLPSWLGEVTIYPAPGLPLDAAGQPDPAKRAAIKALVTAAAPEKDNTDGLQLLVSATFTADPLVDYLHWWLDRTGIPHEIKLSPYNQVFQALLQQDEPSGQRIHILLIRWEDWGRDENNLHQLLSILQNNIDKAQYIAGILPPSAGSDPETTLFIENLNRQYTTALQAMPHVRTLDLATIPADFQITRFEDQVRDRLGHIPFTEEAYGAMATMLARQVRAALRPALKLIVLDCDNTLWKGTCGEEVVSIDPNHLALQQFLRKKQQEGFLLALCSKNNEADVWRVFESHPDMLLRKEDIVTWRINWQPKPGNIDDMVRELNIGIDAVAFIDDNPMECAAVATALPQVFVWQLPEDTSGIPAQLPHLWAFDKYSVTREDRTRTSLYKAEQARQSLIDGHTSLSDFLSQLQLHVAMTPLRETDRDRVVQLMERTNQFNANGRRMTAAAITRYLDAGGQCWTIRVRDKFGDYGLTGVILGREEIGTLHLDSFLLSCRVLGRQVEHALLSGLRRRALETHLKKLTVSYNRTDRNQPFLEMLRSTGWTPASEGEAGATDYEIAVDLLPEALPSITLHYDADLPSEPAPAAGTTSSTGTPTADSCIVVFDHIGIAVANPAEALPFYESIGFTVEATCYDPLQNVNLMMARSNGGGGIELISSYDERSPINGILAAGGDQPYHFCYRTPDLALLFDWLGRNGVGYETVKSPERAILFDYKRVVFLQIQHVGLVEFIEDATLQPDPVATLPSAVQIETVSGDLAPALRFFRLLGYMVAHQSTDPLRKDYTVTLTAPGGNIVHLTRPGTDSDNASFLQRNGAHLTGFRLLSDLVPGMPRYCHPGAQAAAELPPPITSPSILAHRDSNDVRYLCLYYNTGSRLLQLPLYEVKKEESRDWRSAQRSPEEEFLCEVWSEVLRHDNWSLTTSFMEAGGNSIKATQVLSRIYRQYGIELQLTAFFRQPTIRALAAQLRDNKPQGFDPILPAEPRPVYPLSFAQHDLWVSDLLAQDAGTVFNIPVAYELTGQLDRDALDYAFRRLVQRHEILRTVFVREEDEPGQRILPPEQCVILPQWVDLSLVPDPAAEALRLAARETVLPFNLQEGPLMRIKIIATGTDKHVLLMTTHHIISDGWSAGILFKEIALLYTACRQNKSVPLAPLNIQYKDYSVWQRDQMATPNWQEHKRYWLTQFADGIPRLQLPTDHPRPTFKSFMGRTLSFSLDTRMTADIRETIQRQNASLFMFCMAAAQLLLYRLSGQRQLVTGFPISGRQHPDLADQVGCYVNTIPLVTHIDPQVSLGDFLRQIMQEITTAYTHAAWPVGQLVTDLGGHSDLSRAPLFDVMVQIQDAHTVHQADADMPAGLGLDLCEQEQPFSKYDLTINIRESTSQIDIDLEYSTDLFRDDTIAGFQQDLIRMMHLMLNDPSTLVGDTRIDNQQRHLMQQFYDTIASDIDDNF